ncbi:DUF6221 family protein [Streptomyces rubiginosohelvolus]|uniref:DUF6221 family protein n=1 Tax=Streptomyces rubiginosohelvolus TaxID=67362 RepID=UPI00367F693A
MPRDGDESASPRPFRVVLGQRFHHLVRPAGKHDDLGVSTHAEVSPCPPDSPQSNFSAGHSPDHPGRIVPLSTCRPRPAHSREIRRPRLARHRYTVDFCQGELSGFHPTIALHVALHDPARVVRGVEAGRRVLARHVLSPATGDPELPWDNRDDCQYDGETWPCDDLLDLASRYADHPDYPRRPRRP